MNSRIRVFLRWLLAPVALAISTFAVFVLSFGWMFLPDRSVVAVLSKVGLAPLAIVHASHLVDFLALIFIWVIPPAYAIAFAGRINRRRALSVALTFAVLLFAVLCFFIGRSNPAIERPSVAVFAIVLVLVATGLSFSKLNSLPLLTSTNLLAILVLFIPSAIALVPSRHAPPAAKQVWSAVLQPEEWWQASMNTGSEYAATRQVVFVGDRVVAVYDAGDAGYQGKQPMSNYSIVSLDAKTGAKKNEIGFVGRWGAMPYIYATPAGQIDLQSDPPRVLNPDLSPAIDSDLPRTKSLTPTPKHAASSNFDPTRHELAKDRVLHDNGKQVQVLNPDGKVLTTVNLVEPGTYAGASSDGRRFAINSSYTEGDPDFVVYEYFTIYDSSDGRPIATIPVHDLPERQSWSAFSPDGSYFVAGSPSKLTVYELP